MSLIPKDHEVHGNRSWKVTTQPAIEPVTLEDAKTFARIDGDDEDEMLTGFIKGTRQRTESYLGRALISQTITMVMDWWPGVVIKLPRPPLISITSVSTVDEDDAATVYASSNYYIMIQSTPGQLVLKQGVTHPYNTARDYGGYKIIYLAGYGIGSASVPQTIANAIMMWVTICYEDRIVSEEPPEGVKALLNIYKVPRMNY